MAFNPVTNVAQIQLVGATDGQETINDLYFVSTAPPITALSLSILTDTVGGWYSANIAPLLSASWVYSHARGRDLSEELGFVATSVSGGGAVGGIAGEQSPSNVAANLTFGIGRAGRNNHGSNRVPAIPNSVVDTNTLDTEWLQDIIDAYFSLIAPSAVLPGGWTWCVTKRFSGFTVVEGKKIPTPLVPAEFHEIFDVYFTDNIVDSQKTRLPKHGR